MIKKLLPILFLALLVQSCSNNDDPISIGTKTVVDVTSTRPNLSTLNEALIKAELVSTLDADGSFTVLAPTNAAFTAFLQAKGYASLDDVPKATLKNILLNHVISGEFKAADFSTEYKNTLAVSEVSGGNMSIYIDNSNGVKFNGISTVTTANVDADNGTIHVVDNVIDLPTVVTFVKADANFSTLVSALTRSDLTTNFVATLETKASVNPAPFTVFAPTNTAFVNVLAELKLAALANIPVATLDLTLKNHVIAGTNARSEDLSDNMMVTSLNSELKVNVTGGATIARGTRVSNITKVDIQANNGVVHAIDKVIL